MKIAVIGATGLVGLTITELIKEYDLPVTSFIAVASQKSIGKEIMFSGKKYPVLSLSKAVGELPDIAIFSAGSAVSSQWAPQFAKNGTYVIDNSSAWRMYDNIPLIVPEINGEILKPTDFIIANPNCSTIQMVMVLSPLDKKFEIKRIVVSTYQSVTGSGYKGLQQLEAEQEGEQIFTAYPNPIFQNVLPYAGDFTDNGYTTEEMKLINETRKIFNNNDLAITATAARVPVKGGHSEAVNVTFEKNFTVLQIRELLTKMPGVQIVDNPAQNIYPMPIDAEGNDTVFVGRIRKDISVENGLNLWIVADNLRKGAATNAIQIAKLLIDNGFVKK